MATALLMMSRVTTPTIAATAPQPRGKGPSRDQPRGGHVRPPLPALRGEGGDGQRGRVSGRGLRCGVFAFIGETPSHQRARATPPKRTVASKQ